MFPLENTQSCHIGGENSKYEFTECGVGSRIKMTMINSDPGNLLIT